MEFCALGRLGVGAPYARRYIFNWNLGRIMKISTIEIQSWRSIKSLKVSFQELMILIGQNNHGKSNVLNAILFFFGEIKPQALDFNEDQDELFVEITFDELGEHEKLTFSKYVTVDNQIRVRKTATKSGSMVYQGYTQTPIEDCLKESNASSYTNRSIAEATPFSYLLPESGRITQAIIKQAQSKYIEQNLGIIDFSYELESTNFLGAKNVAKGIFGDVFHIPAIKVASDDYSNKETSLFGKLYGRIISELSESNVEWEEAKNRMSALFKLLNKEDDDGNLNPSRPEQLNNFENSLNGHLSDWGADIELEVIAPNVDEVFRSNTQVWINDGFKTDISRKGNGLQRALSFALIKTLADKLREQQSSHEETARSSSRSMFFLLEEPELYLHPQAQRALLESLVALSEAGAQVILCTHSSSLIDLSKYKSICIVRKESTQQGTKACQCTDELFVGDGKKDFNLSYWINPDRSELFFAKKVVLVEGATEKTVIPFLAQSLSVFKHDYSVIDCGSKNNIPMYCNLLNKFGIPYVAVYDIDHQAHKNDQARQVADARSQAIEDAIVRTLGSSVTLVSDIEEELGMPRGVGGKPYAALEHVSQAGFAMPESVKEKILSIYE
ncbi:AAA family ATPase [Photobacterium sp. SDRW27]|uniref:ATP-dependent nuclease n=1 Tax=Photobacterium obscurum TaxID=2829490 RepID=UPI002243629F|nr:AAA family ATPase [Photobacterium obscurum]MCW8331750.1 AAA family ATPase [Photobacterium obscurum]